MKRLNKERVNQVDAMRLIDDELNQEFADLSDRTRVKIVHFDVYFAIENGSVLGSVYFEEIAKLLKQ